MKIINIFLFLPNNFLSILLTITPKKHGGKWDLWETFWLAHLLSEVAKDLHITHTYVVYGVPYQYTIFWCCLHLLINPGILCHTNVSNDGQSCQNIPSTHMISIHPIEGLRDTMILQCPFIPGMSSSCLINNLCLASSCRTFWHFRMCSHHSHNYVLGIN